MRFSNALLPVLAAVTLGAHAVPTCAPGHHLVGATRCKSCPSGTFGPGDNTCSPCAAGWYQPSRGAAACMACPVNKGSTPGATHCSSCGPAERHVPAGYVCNLAPAWNLYGNFQNTGRAAGAGPVVRRSGGTLESQWAYMDAADLTEFNEGSSAVVTADGIVLWATSPSPVYQGVGLTTLYAINGTVNATLPGYPLHLVCNKDKNSYTTLTPALGPSGLVAVGSVWGCVFEVHIATATVQRTIDIPNVPALTPVSFTMTYTHVGGIIVSSTYGISLFPPGYSTVPTWTSTYQVGANPTFPAKVALNTASSVLAAVNLTSVVLYDVPTGGVLSHLSQPLGAGRVFDINPPVLAEGLGLLITFLPQFADDCYGFYGSFFTVLALDIHRPHAMSIAWARTLTAPGSSATNPATFSFLTAPVLTRNGELVLPTRASFGPPIPGACAPLGESRRRALRQQQQGPGHRFHQRVLPPSPTVSIGVSVMRAQTGALLSHTDLGFDFINFQSAAYEALLPAGSAVDKNNVLYLAGNANPTETGLQIVGNMTLLAFDVTTRTLVSQAAAPDLSGINENFNAVAGGPAVGPNGLVYVPGYFDARLVAFGPA